VTASTSGAGGFTPRGATLLAVILALGLGLRCVGLSGSLWIDEVDTLVTIVRQPLATIVTSYASENQHPLYSVLAKIAVTAFGETEVALRLPALLFGVLSLWAVARLGRQLLDETTGLLAALLLCVSAHHVWFSQNARGYTGMLLFTVLASSEFLQLLGQPKAGSEEGKRALRIVSLRYALFAALAAYTHLTALFAFAGHGLVWLLLAIRGQRDAGGGAVAEDSAAARSLVDCEPLPPARAGSAALFAMAGAAGLALLLHAPLLGDLADAFAARASGARVQVAKVETWTDPRWLLAAVATSLGGAWSAVAGLAAALVLMAAGVVSLWRNGRRRFVLMHLLAPPLALLVLLSLRRHLYPRFFFFEAGFAAIALVRGARISGGFLSCSLPGCKVQRSARWGIALVLAVAAGSAWSLERVFAHPKQDFIGARDFVAARAAAGDARVAVGPAKLALPGWYARDWRTADTAAELAAIRAAAATTWLVYTLPEQLAAARPDVWAAVQAEFQAVAEFEGSMGGGTVFVARSRR
jgi:hypothetical protein